MLKNLLKEAKAANYAANGNEFIYKIGNKESIISNLGQAIIEKAGNLNPPNRIDDEFEKAVEKLYEVANAAEVEIPKFAVLKGQGGTKFHMLLAETDLANPDKDFSSKSNFEEVYKHALAGIANQIIGERFNEFANRIYSQAGIYSYDSIINEAKKILPSKTHIPIVNESERSI